MSDLDSWLLSELAQIEAAHLRRSLRRLDSSQGVDVVVDGHRLINFSSNDYLGLANDSRLKAAASAAIDRFGAGAGSARLICGNLAPHAELDEAFAKFKGTESALAFSTGYAAALGTIPALVGKGDVVILDKLCHACLVDAARLSGATIRVFPHNQLGKLERLLSGIRDGDANAKVLVVTESVFSMDGDLAPLRDIVELKERFGAWLMVDEAHGVGVLGPRGRGLAAELGIVGRIDVQMSTLGKALGSAGGVICGSSALIEFLVNRARSFIFSTAPAPGVAAAATEAVRLLDGGSLEPERRSLWDAIAGIGRALNGPRAASAILPLIVGSESLTIELSFALRQAGILVGAVRYPTVARNQARLRFTACALHSMAHVESLTNALDQLRGRLGDPVVGPPDPRD